MNTDQIASYIRTALKMIGAVLLAHGYSKAGGEINNMINMPDIIGFAATGIGILWSHFNHSSSNGGSNAAGLLLALMLPALCFTGCESAPTNAYKAETAAAVTVETAMTVWGDYVATAQPPISQELAVKAAFEKYQAAELLAIDATAAYVSLTSTNSSAGNPAAVTSASAAAAQSLSDLVNLIKSFGVKL